MQIIRVLGVFLETLFAIAACLTLFGTLIATFPETSLVLADFVESAAEAPFLPEPCRHRVLDALNLDHHENLYGGHQNHLRACAL